MSTGSTHCNFGRTCWRLMVVASSRFWMSILRRSASSRTTAAKACSRGSPASAGALCRMVAAPRIEASGVRNSCDTEPISASRNSSVSERILASLSARATSSRSSVAAASASASSMRWRMSASGSPETLPRSTATRPKSGVFGDTRRISQTLPVPSVDGALEPFVMLDARHRGAHRFRHVVGGAGVGDAEQHHLALHQIGEMLLDGDENLRRARRHGKPARERVEVAHLAFALAGNEDVFLGLAGQVRDHHGDDHEQQEIERLLRRGDLEAVELREIEIAREQHAGDRGHQRRNDAELIAGQHHRHEIEHRAAQDADIVA